MTKRFRQQATITKPVMKEDKKLLSQVNDDTYGLANLGENIEQLEVPKEMYHFLKIMELGAKKHGANNWLNPNGKRSSEKDMHESMFHHLAESYALGQLYKNNPVSKVSGIKDKDTGLDPLLHLACRALMMYTRRQKLIVHEEDSK
jgi:hypothetical protein